MTKTIIRAAFAAALTITLCALPAQAQRVFVSGSGSDSNPCTFTAPCRTFAQAFATAPTNGEIDVLDPAGYGALTITHGISIQAHGFGGITAATSGANAITINAGTSDAITLNGLLIDGTDAGHDGILINSGASVQILNCVIRRFTGYGVDFFSSTNPTNLLIADTVVSDNSATAFELSPQNGNSATPVTLTRVTANNNANGVGVVSGTVMIQNAILSNNVDNGLHAVGGTTWLGASAISGNNDGVFVSAAGGTVYSYQNNDINGNTTDISGGMTAAAMR
jgi:hypothetical protein